MGLNNDDIKQLIAILQRGLVEEPLTEQNITPTTQPKKTRVKKETATQPKKKKSLNKFSRMPEFNMCKEDVEIDKKIRKPPPSERKPPFEHIKVQCRVCGKKDKVAPMLIESIERYKCNKCSTGAG
jgi:hypothetical protein